jgi:catalase
MLTPAEAIDRLRAPFKPPPGYRSAHAKGAFYEGTFVATPQAAELCRAEHFGGTEVPVLVRWSNAAGTPRDPDSKPDIHGMALKFRPGAGDTDLLGQTSPRFPTDDPEVFVDMVEPSVQLWKLPLFLARHPGTVPSVVAGLRHGVKAPVSYAEVSYYPIHAYGWLDAKGDRTWVRYVFRPVANRGRPAAAEVLRTRPPARGDPGAPGARARGVRRACAGRRRR